jgi:biotin carboxylase
MSDIKRAMVIAGGQWQVPIIKFLQGKGYKVSVVDPYNTSPGVLIADEHIKLDVRDVTGVIDFAKDTQYSLVTTDQSDISVETVSKLATHFGVNGNGIDVVKRFTNKYLSRQFASEVGVPVPAFCKVNNIAEVKECIAKIGLPVILKPVDSQSSRGIFMINEQNVDQLEELVPLTFKESREQYILVEEFFIGTELTVEGICSNHEHKTLAISQKKHFRTGIASDLFYPAILPREVEEAVISHNDHYIRKSGLKFGITHAEYLYNSDSGKICLVEIACRGGGSLISSDIAKWVSGVDIYEIYLTGLEGNTYNVNALTTLKRPAVLHFFEFPNGIVEAVEGLDEIRRMNGTVAIKMDFEVGTHIKAANDDRSRQGFVIILAEDKAQLESRLALVNDTLKVTLKSV